MVKTGIFFLFWLSSIFVMAQKNEIRQVLSPEAFLAKMQEKDSFYLIDVRTGFEYKKHRIKGAVHNSYLNPGFKSRLKGLDTDRPVFIYCESEHRSPYAAKKLRKAGFTEIYDLKDGFKNWRNQELPVEKPGPNE